MAFNLVDLLREKASIFRAYWFQGFRTLDDLHTKAKLTHQQKIGLKHYEDILDRMPRTEAAAIEQVVGSIINHWQQLCYIVILPFTPKKLKTSQWVYYIHKWRVCVMNFPVQIVIHLLCTCTSCTCRIKE